MNHQRLLAPDRGVPQGYRYVDTDTGFLTRSNTLPELVRDATKHRTANGLPVPDDFARIVETQLCENLPPGLCVYVGGGTPDAQECRTGVKEIIKAAEAIGLMLADHATGHDVFIGPVEANQRAATCLRCPKHVPVDGCQSCGLMAGAKELLAKIRGDRRLEQEDKVQACCVCGCWIKLTAWVKRDYLLVGQTPVQMDRRPEHCWYR